jgi:hypothetical protein
MRSNSSDLLMTSLSDRGKRAELAFYGRLQLKLSRALQEFGCK